MTFLTFGSLSIAAGFLTLFLPETMNRGLPDTVVQANDLVQGRRKRSSLLRGRSGVSNDSIDEVGYGKSPEWVEVSRLAGGRDAKADHSFHPRRRSVTQVDGMIVSRGVLESNGGADTLSRGGTLGKTSATATAADTGAGGNHRGGARGSGTHSLPHSNRTLLTNSSTRSAVYGGKPILPGEDESISHARSRSSSENAYETLPALQGQEEPGPPPLPPVPQPRAPGRQGQHFVQLNRPPSAEAGFEDVSVVSAHHVETLQSVVSMTSKGLFKDKILLSSDLGDETRL